MLSTRKTARLAGLIYVLASIPAFYGLMYVPSKLLVRGDPASTARNILASQIIRAAPSFGRSRGGLTRLHIVR